MTSSITWLSDDAVAPLERDAAGAFCGFEALATESGHSQADRTPNESSTEPVGSQQLHR